MTARTRAKPRATRAPRSKRKGKPFFTRKNIYQPEIIGLVIVGAVLVSLPFLVDMGEVFTRTRDWIVETTGLGLFIIAALSVVGGWAISRRAYEDAPLFARRAAGIVAFGLFFWGALGLNKADWTLGNVSFREVSLGGDVGRGLVHGPIGILAWLSLLLIALALLAPHATAWFARNFPAWLRTAWEREYPHRFARGVAAFVRYIFKHPGREPAEERIVIGNGVELDRRPAPSFETAPAVYRPSIDPASPVSVVGAGAAAHFDPESVHEEPSEFDETMAAPPLDAAADLPIVDGVEDEPDEPQQLEMPMASPGFGWQLPAMELLNPPQVSQSRKHDNAARAQLIVDTLASFGVDATVVEVNEGPTVTQFGVEPGWEVRYKDLPLKDETGKTLLGPDGRPRTERVEQGRTRVRVNKITALQNDLALALAAPSLRIEAPVPGRAIVGIEVPNDSATVVTMRGVMETKEFQDLARKSKLAVALGKGVSGVPVVADLARMPHLLIAGATGSGKSVCMNAIIAGIMMNASPNDVRFVMVDPKRVELTPYSHIPHLAFSEVIVDMDKVVGTLQAVVSEMEARYKKFAAMAVRNIESYNRHPRVVTKLPYWVIIIDELADLMMAAPFEVEKLICRLAQLARATGIHLVVATQRPSVDVITGLIKANFPTRIAFAVTSMTDSRTILDMGGAEKLLGRGDMLYMPTDASKPIRIQGVYLSDAEVERLVEFWTDDRFSELAPERHDELLEQALIEQNGGDIQIDIEREDPIVQKARELAREHTRVSPSLFQRRLRIGYVKALKVVEILEEDGIVGPREDGESRRVIQSAAAAVAVAERPGPDYDDLPFDPDPDDDA
ncbi:MAG: DNA translocase FtsK [Dehalococcoidia bacterium]|nr:DNA translocase FtsK [Dehalococcoidia bacterium]